MLRRMQSVFDQTHCEHDNADDHDEMMMTMMTTMMMLMMMIVVMQAT